MKLNKSEIFLVEGFDWNVEVKVLMDDYDNVDDVMIEAATMALEGVYYSDPNNFKVGSVVKISFKRKTEYIKWGNTYILLCNASLFKLAENVRKNFLEQNKVDLSKDPIIKT